MASLNPRAPTRKQLKEILGDDKRLIKAFEQLFEIVPDDIDAANEVIRDALYSWVGPALSGIQAYISERDKTISDQTELIASLFAIVGTLKGRLSELVKLRPIQSESTDYQMLNDDLGVNADASSAAFDVTLPDPAKNKGKTYFLSNTGGSGNVTWLPFASETIGGQSSLVLPSSVPFSTIEVTSDGSNYLMS